VRPKEFHVAFVEPTVNECTGSDVLPSRRGHRVFEDHAQALSYATGLSRAVTAFDRRWKP